MIVKENLDFLKTDLRIRFIITFGVIALLRFVAAPLLLSLLVSYYL